MLCAYCKTNDSIEGLCDECLDHCQSCDDSGCQKVVCGRNDIHYCQDWDFMVIDATSPEYECCTCPNA